jgi:hypothetical protein
MQKQISLGVIEFREDHSQPPFRKAHIHPLPEELDDQQSFEEDGTQNESSDEENIGLQVMPSVIYKQSQVAVKLLRRLMGSSVFENPKDYEIIARLIRYVTAPGDIILDSFAGSGTTGHAVLDLNAKSIEKMGRQFILVEMDTKIAKEITSTRLSRTIQGYQWDDQKNISHHEDGVGGGFRYCELGPTLFDASGQIRPEVKFDDLAAHVFFTETGQPLPSTEGAAHSPLLGFANGAAIYLLYNGIMRDQGNVLTPQTLDCLPPYAGPRVIFGDGCKIGKERLLELGITFRQIPYEVKVR